MTSRRLRIPSSRVAHDAARRAKPAKAKLYALAECLPIPSIAKFNITIAPAEISNVMEAHDAAEPWQPSRIDIETNPANPYICVLKQKRNVDVGSARQNATASIDDLANGHASRTPAPAPHGQRPGAHGVRRFEPQRTKGLARPFDLVVHPRKNRIGRFNAGVSGEMPQDSHGDSRLGEPKIRCCRCDAQTRHRIEQEIEAACLRVRSEVRKGLLIVDRTSRRNACAPRTLADQ